MVVLTIFSDELDTGEVMNRNQMEIPGARWHSALWMLAVHKISTTEVDYELTV
jgi:hypothetical protein